MGVDQTSLDRIRNATFPSARRGYDKHEVEKFLARLADWLETGGGDESRSETVKRELERVGERTGAILAQAEESAQQIRSEAEQEARETTSSANTEATQARSEADAYSKQTRTEADSYAEQTRATAEQEAAETRARAEQDAQEAIADAQAQARRIVEEGTRRREDIESVIADLVRRRDEVLADIDELSTKLNTAVSDHRPAGGADPFDRPDELDPAQRDGGEPEAEEEEPLYAEDEDLEAELTDEPAEEEAAAEPERKTGKAAKARRGRSRRVSS